MTPEIKKDVAITCAFGRRLGMSTISPVPTLRQICMCVQLGASIRSQGIGFWKKNAANSIYLCVLGAHFSPVKCSETILHPRASFPDPIYGSTHRPLLECIFSKMPRVRAGTLIHYFIRIYRIALLQESRIARNEVSR